MGNKKMIYKSTIPTANIVDKPVEFEVRVMAIAEGYAMFRRKGGMPFVCSVKELKEFGIGE